MILGPSRVAPLATLGLTRLTGSVFPTNIVGVLFNENGAINSPLANRPGIQVISLANSVTANRRVVDRATSSVGHARVRLNNGTPIVIFSSTSVRTIIRNMHAFNCCGTKRSYATTYQVCTRGNVCSALIRGLNTTITALGSNTPSSRSARLKPLDSLTRLRHIDGTMRRTGTAKRVGIVANNRGHGNGNCCCTPALLTNTLRSSTVIRGRMFNPMIDIAPFSGRRRIIG